MTSQVPIAVGYKGIQFDQGSRADLTVEEIIIGEFKSVEQLTATHRKQLQTYLRLMDIRLDHPL